MGSWFRSSSESEKTVDATGAINNNIIMTEDKPIDVYSSELVILISILVALRSAEFIYFIYRAHQRKMKRKYQANNNQKA